jgi:hypothetical protein
VTIHCKWFKESLFVTFDRIHYLPVQPITLIFDQILPNSETLSWIIKQIKTMGFQPKIYKSKIYTLKEIIAQIIKAYKSKIELKLYMNH